MKRVFAMVMAVVMAAVIFAGCSAGGNNNASNNSGSGDTIKVGLLGPHSGEYAVYGLGVRNGAELYFKKVNEAGGINGKKIELVVYDNKGDDTEAVTAFTRMVDEGVTALVGDVLTGSGVPEEKAEAFQEACRRQYGQDAALNPRNIIEAGKFQITTPEVKITVPPEYSYMVETRIIDGRRFILIPADDGVEVNGIPVTIPNPQA